MGAAEMEACCGCTGAYRERQYVPQMFAAGQSAADEHGLMFIRLCGAEAVQIGKCAGVSHRGVARRVAGLRRENLMHGGESARIAPEVANGILPGTCPMPSM